MIPTFYIKKLFSSSIKYYTVTVQTNPTSTVTLTYDGNSYTSNSAIVKKDTVVNYSVSHSLYGVKTGSVKVDSDKLIKCTGRYSTRTITTDESWIRPNLTESGTLGGSDYAISATHGNANAYKAVDSNTGSTWQSAQTTGYNHTETLTFYSPVPIKLTNLTFTAPAWKSAEGWSYRYQIGKGTISVSNNNNTWTDVATFNNIGGYKSTVSIDLSTESYYSYYKIYCSNLNAYAPNNYYYCWLVSNIAMTGTYQKTTTSYTYYWSVTVTGGT